MSDPTLIALKVFAGFFGILLSVLGATVPLLAIFLVRKGKLVVPTRAVNASVWVYRCSSPVWYWIFFIAEIIVLLPFSIYLLSSTIGFILYTPHGGAYAHGVNTRQPGAANTAPIRDPPRLEITQRVLAGE